MCTRHLYNVIPREGRRPLVVVTTIHGEAPKEPPKSGRRPVARKQNPKK